jgi:hypothetical protein
MNNSWGYLWLVLATFLFLRAIFKYKLHWPTYSGFAALFLSLVVGRRENIDRLVLLPDAFYTGCVVLGLLFTAATFVILVLGPFPQPQPPPPHHQSPGPEISYTFERTRAAWSLHQRVPLVLQAPPEPQQPLHGLGGYLFAGGLRDDPITVVGQPIGALYKYEILLVNTGNQSFRELPIQIDLLVPGYLGAGAPADEAIIEAPSVTPPPGAHVQFEQRGPVTVVGTCDLFNQEERLRVGFYTKSRMFPDPAPRPRVVARAENLPRLVECQWPDNDDEPLRPLQPDYDTLHRGRLLNTAGVRIILLGRLLTRVGGRIGFKRVVRRQRE